MRLFIGIPLAAAVIDELSATVLRLQSQGDGLRWQPSESWHITLQFLGNAEEKQYGCIVSELRKLCLPPLRIQLQEMGFFNDAGIFFAAVERAPGLISLQQHVNAATGLCGFVPETRAYHPHITLARRKTKSGRPGLRNLKGRIGSQPEFTSFMAGSFLLYESVPARDGSRYEIRERFPLHSNPATTGQ